MNSTCPHCETTFRLDPRKVPANGVRARCSVCSGVFQVVGGIPEAGSAAGEEQLAAQAPPAPDPAPAAAADPSAPPPPPPLDDSQNAAAGFGAADPHSRARRLARALVSDISVYHPERLERSRGDGTLRQEFREEIRKSWEEYVAQVGDATARSTPYFREALNDILAGGSPVF